MHKLSSISSGVICFVGNSGTIEWQKAPRAANAMLEEKSTLLVLEQPAGFAFVHCQDLKDLDGLLLVTMSVSTCLLIQESADGPANPRQPASGQAHADR